MHGQHASILSGTDVPCPACGYDLRGTVEAERCPECGATLYPLELTERRNVQADALADDCRFMAFRDALLVLVFVGAMGACFFNWRIAAVALPVGLFLWDFILAPHAWLDPAEGGIFDRFEYMLGRRVAFDDTKKMLKFPGLNQTTRKRLTRWRAVGRAMLVTQVAALIAFVCLLIWSIVR